MTFGLFRSALPTFAKKRNRNSAAAFEFDFLGYFKENVYDTEGTIFKYKNLYTLQMPGIFSETFLLRLQEFYPQIRILQRTRSTLVACWQAARSEICKINCLRKHGAKQMHRMKQENIWSACIHLNMFDIYIYVNKYMHKYIYLIYVCSLNTHAQTSRA